jgi:hypothetical protein
MPNLAKRIEDSKPLRVVVATFCILFSILAIAVNAINREALDHKGEEQNTRLATVETTNDQILKAVLDPSPGLSETERRRRIEDVLRNKYILTHSDVSADLLAGTEWPPTEWMNRELSDLHETWKFTGESHRAPIVIQQMLPEAKKAQIGISFYKEDLQANPSHEIEAVLDPLDPLAFKVDVAVFGMGDVPAKIVHYWLRLCVGCAWASEPAGSVSVAEHPLDREFTEAEVLPDVAVPKITLSIKRPNTFMARIPIALYYACDNCPVLDSSKPPVVLWVNLGSSPTPPSLSAPYIPIQVPQ